jgi:hypothetical protein
LAADHLANELELISVGLDAPKTVVHDITSAEHSVGMRGHGLLI